MDIEHCLICECHLVEIEELKTLIKEFTGDELIHVEDLKKNRIIGHGCGQCLKSWEQELELLLLKNSLTKNGSKEDF